MKGRICVVTTVHPHDDVRIYHKQARSLAAAGYQVTVLCPDHQGEDDAGIRFVRLHIPGGRLGRLCKGWRIALGAALREDAQLYHFHDPELLPMAVALSRRGKPVIYDVHEDLPRQILAKHWIAEWHRPIISRWAEWYENRAVARLAGVVAATEVIGRRFPGSILFRNYPDEREFLDKEQIPYLQRQRNLCYVGAISEVRGIRQMIEALPGLDARLQLAGAFEGPNLRREVERQAGYPLVDYHGVLGRGDVVTLLGRCRVGLLLLQPTESYRESLPIKLFEYMLAGLPVVASDFALWRELTGGRAVFVDPQEPEAIREAIRHLLQNPDRAQELGERGKKFVLERYRLSGEVERLLKLYRSLLPESSTDEKGGKTR